jgi:hypothetical protein
MSSDDDVFREKRLAGTDTPADWRNELARRIRGVRMVSRQNDPCRAYRTTANKCRKGEMSYNRIFGIPKVPKE